MRLGRVCCVAYAMDELDGTDAVPLVAIYRGRRYYLITSAPVDRMWLESMDGVAIRVQVAAGDRDLILNPTEDDLHLAAAYERGEISAFEYPDGHTCRATVLLIPFRH